MPALSPTEGRLYFLVLFLTGAGLRLTHFLARRSLWLDEAMLALNIASRPFGELLRPLDYNQTAPLLFLWIERLMVVAAGANELALRAFPMASGLLLLALLWPLGRRLAGEAGALAAVTLAAFSPTLIRHANEAKPYGSDALVTAALILSALRLLASPGSRGRWMLLLLADSIGILVSTPGVFVAAAVATALTLDPSIRRRRGAWLAACAVSWASIAALLYFFLYRSAATNPYQQQAYEAGFLFPGPGWDQRAILALRGTVLPSFLGNGSAIPSLSSAWLWPIVAVLLAGLVRAERRNGASAAALLAAPLLFTLLASCLRRYPLGVPRLMVFASPLLILMAASAVGGLVTWLRQRVRTAILAAAGIACAAPMAWARLGEAREPFAGEDAAALVAAFRERPRIEEPVYINAKGIPSWLFYTTNWKAPNRDRLDFYARAAGSGPSFENAPPRNRFVWNEGADLVYAYRERREILGIATGRQWRWPSYTRPYPDEGWAANEAARVAREAEPCTWLYFTRLSEGGHKPVTWHLRDTYGGRREFEIAVPGGLLYRYCFPYTRARLAQMANQAAGLPFESDANGGSDAAALPSGSRQGRLETKTR